jgi:hypothetical protein
MTLRSNGSIIGSVLTTTTSSASGVWSIDEHSRRIAASNWPAAAATTTVTTITCGSNGYYNYQGWADSVQYSSSSSAMNMGSATGAKALLNGDPITGFTGISNPGTTSFHLWANGSSGNAGWTKCAGATTVGGTSYTGHVLRADCVYTADSSNLTNWNQAWSNNPNSHTYTGTHLYQMCMQFQSTPSSGTVTFTLT